MAQPIIFDDGGSTRIKYFDNGVGDMATLLNVNDAANPPQSTHTVNGNYTNAKLIWLGQDGVATPEMDVDLNPGDTLNIASLNDQSVTVTIGPAGECVITILGSGTVSPLVEAKQFKKQRRYVVANAGPIKTVDAKIGGVAQPTFNAIANHSVYTTLVLNQ